MKLYYYEYETIVFSGWEAGWQRYTKQGFLMETPLGILQFYDADECNVFNSLEEFVSYAKNVLSCNFNIVELV